MRYIQKFAFLWFFALVFAHSVFAQEAAANASAQLTAPVNDLIRNFDDYSLTLPNATWRVASKTSSPEIVYGDRLDGYLQIRQVTVDDGKTFADVIEREQNQKLQFLPGYVNGKEETFKGNLSGKVANYEFTQSGKPMIGRAYFLQDGEKNVYVLRFTGSRDKLRLLRNQTDQIARSFKLKAA